MHASSLHVEAAGLLTRPLRVLLLASADSPAGLRRAFESEADAVVVDLEGVSAEQARDTVPSSLSALSGRPDDPQLFVKTHAIGSEEIAEDLDLVMRLRPHAVILPAAVGERDISHLGAKLAVAEAEHGFPHGSIGVLSLSADTPAAILALPTLARTGSRWRGAVWDAARTALPLNVVEGSDEAACHLGTIRTLLLVAARAAERPAFAVLRKDEQGAAAPNACRIYRELGFAGIVTRDVADIDAIRYVF